MTHEQATERLDDFACGELPDIERVRVQRHVEGCDECRAEVEAIQALLADAAVLPRAITPPVDLWAGISARLEPRVTPLHVVETVAEERVAESAAEETRVISLASRRRGWQAPRWALQLAAALLLVAGSSAITARIVSEQARQQGTGTLDPIAAKTPQTGQQGSAEPAPVRTGDPATLPAARGTAAPTAFAAFGTAEDEYETAIADLERVLDTRRGQMAPETVQTLERNLRIIDTAIAESRAALERDPNSRELIDMLSATYDAKVKVLRQAVEI
ncbi:MAG TPA: zf-HC2 domain-containing protein [Longimicrobium sp.]|nr:zf-HC2 domain-containing protein [Longimicrobium sp.]